MSSSVMSNLKLTHAISLAIGERAVARGITHMTCVATACKRHGGPHA